MSAPVSTVPHVVKLATRPTPGAHALPHADAVNRLLAGVVCGKPAEVKVGWKEKAGVETAGADVDETGAANADANEAAQKETRP